MQKASSGIGGRNEIGKATTQGLSGTRLSELLDYPLKAKLWQHPVGQGLFHSGRIEISGAKPFQYVYDCGRHNTRSSRKWERILAPICGAYENRKLDAVFISHFDADHVNGLSTLLKKFGGAELVFLPYINPVARLMTGIREMLRSPNDVTADYIHLLATPVDWLLGNGAREVIYVWGPDDPETREGNPVQQPEIPQSNSDPESPRYRLSLETAPEPHERLDITDAEAQQARSNSRVSFLDCRWPISLLSAAQCHWGWTFQTFVDPDRKWQEAVNRMVLSALGAHDFDAVCRGNTSCGDILSSEIAVEALKGAYSKALAKQGSFGRLGIVLPNGQRKRADTSQMNRSSMSLYSGPHLFGTSAPASTYETLCLADKNIWPTRPCAASTGWLLTGDAVLSDEGVLRRFTGFYDAPSTTNQGLTMLKRTQVFGAPHHGSKNNFGEYEFYKVGLPRCVMIPAADGKYYGHPDKTLVKNLKQNGCEVIHVHEETSPGLVYEVYAC